MMQFYNVRQFLLGIFACMMWTSAIAQNSNEAKSLGNTYLITNAKVTTEPGVLKEGYSILIKDGIIKELGLNVKQPFDAQVIKADSMYIYPGFIAAASHIGMKKEDKKKRPSVDDPGNPPNKVAGIQPQREMSSIMSIKEKSIKDARSVGFTVAHTLPEGRMLPGQGSIVTLEQAKEVDDILLDDNSSLFAQLRPASGRIYPSTTIAVISKWREMYKNAELSKKYQDKYALNPNGLSKPIISSEIQALIPAVSKKQKVYFKAEKTLDIHRVLALHKDQQFDLVLCNTKQANQVLNKLSSLQNPILVSLKLPKEIKEEKEDSTKVVAQEIAGFKERKKKSYDQYVGQASDLENANIKFGFSLIDVKAKDILPNIRRMITAGLSKKTALMALTTIPASLLGISNQTGSIQKGKMANLVISDQPIFEEKAKIKYVFVNGQEHKFEDPKKKSKKKEGGESTVDFVGVWKYEVNIPGDIQTGTMTISKNDNDYSIELVGDDEPDDVDEISEIEVDGNSMSFPLEVESEIGILNVDFDITFDEDSFEGSISIDGMGSFPITASKVDPK